MNSRTTTPVTFVRATDVSQEWIEMRREIIRREGLAVQAGPLANTIEIRSLTTNEWMPIELPGKTVHFATSSDRNAILHLLTT